MDNMITVTDTYFKDLEEKCFRRACAAAQAEMAGVLEQHQLRSQNEPK